MQYHLGRDGSQLGDFPEEEIRDGLRSGRFLPTDLAWSAGMSDWKPLSEVLPDAAPASVSSADAPTPVSEVEVLAPGATSSPSPTYLPAAPSAATPTPWRQPGAAVPNVGAGALPTPGTAIASLVLGILSLITCWFGILLVIPGLICGHMAMNQIKAPGSRYEGRALALTALILNYIWIGLFVIAVFVMFVFGVFAAVAEQTH
jgi:hypothetical protein